MGADLVIYALEQLGVKVSPTVAWAILILGAILIIGAGVGGFISLWKFIHRHRSISKGKQDASILLKTNSRLAKLKLVASAINEKQDITPTGENIRVYIT